MMYAPTNLRPYPLLDELNERVDQLAVACGGVVTTIGHSVQGRMLRAVRIGAVDGPSPAKKLLITANMHGNEWVSSCLALALLERLQDRAHPLRAADVVVVPLVNPDGYAATAACNGMGAPGQLRKNHHGVDLNRNFPWPGGTKPKVWFQASGSDDPRAATYRGSHPGSEPETQALMTLANEGFVGALALHSFMGSLIPPMVHSRAQRRMYRELCRVFRSAQRGPRNFTLMAPWFDVFTGELDDHLHHAHGTWAMTVELYPWWHSLRDRWRYRHQDQSWFWRFNPRDPTVYVDDAVHGCEAVLQHMLTLAPPGA
jgi:hypothetical protein